MLEQNFRGRQKSYSMQSKKKTGLVREHGPVDNERDEEHAEGDLVQPQAANALQRGLARADGIRSPDRRAAVRRVQVVQVAPSGLQFGDFSEEPDLFLGQIVWLGCPLAELLFQVVDP